MRRSAFFLCLLFLFLLPASYSAVVKATEPFNPLSTQDAVTSLPFELGQIDQARFSGSNTSGEQKLRYCEVVDDDDDDDDTREASPKKYRSAATLQPAAYSHPVLTYLHCVAETLPASCYKPSCRYILHRTFKI